MNNIGVTEIMVYKLNVPCQKKIAVRFFIIFFSTVIQIVILGGSMTEFQTVSLGR